MQTERLFEIVYTLLDRGKVTARELADRLNVSRRTILRDIQTLALAKVPVYTTQGKGGGVSLLEGYVLDKAVLSDEEKEQILLGIKTLLPTGVASGRAGNIGIVPKFRNIFEHGIVSEEKCLACQRGQCVCCQPYQCFSLSLRL